MTIEPAQTTLRETLSSNLDKLEETVVETPKAEPVEAVEAKTEPEVKDRPRDETGKFVKSEKPKEAEVKAEAKTEAAPAIETPRPPRPSTWKKDYWDHWEKLDPKLAEYLHQRESEYAKGVSTYKSEWDRAKPLIDAITPYQPVLQQLGMKPEQFVASLASADQTLRYGAPEQKLQAFMKLAQDYQIPVQSLFVQGEDGKIYFNQQYQQQQQPQGITPQEVQRLVHQSMAQAAIAQRVRDFKEAKDSSGNPRYPHFDEVKVTMDGLLRSGLAQDLPDAYEAALRHPKHSALFDAMQKQQREAEEAEKRRKAAEEAAKAKAKAVSPRTQASTGMVTGNSKGKGLRELLSENLESASSRV